MYNKLFSKIVDSSIWLSPDPVRIVWITFLAVMDEDGMVRLPTIANVAHRAIVSQEDAEMAIRVLESPEPSTATEDDDGSRIERVPGGWIVLNAKKYREMATREIQRESTRLRVAKHRERKKAGNGSVTDEKRDVMQSYTVTETVSETEKNIGASRQHIDPYETEFNAFKATYPKRAGDQKWRAARKAINARLSEGATWPEILDGAGRYAAFCKATGKLGTEYVKQAATFVGPENLFREQWTIPKPNGAHRSMEQINRLAASNSMIRRQGESDDDFRDRVSARGL